MTSNGGSDPPGPQLAADLASIVGDPVDRGPVAAPDDSWLPPAPPVANVLDDRGVLLLAGAAAAGAWCALPVPLLLAGAAAAALVAVAHRARRPILLLPAALMLASSLGARALDGLDPRPAQPFAGVVTLVSDPRETPFGTRVDVRTPSGRAELRADGSAAGAVAASLAGEQLQVEGRLAPPNGDAPWLVPRHVRWQLQAERAERHGAGAAPWRAANRIRRLLDRSVDGLDRTARSLYGGMVLGDARDQPPEVVDDFRGAGLSHLLVVSGSNVAFVLVLAGPGLRRLGWRGRWMLTVGVVAAFAMVTRFEPSVLRAAAMAIVAVSGQLAGRPSPSARNLGLAVTALLLIDPLLVRSVGFQLSVAASAAIAWWSAPLAARLRGPQPVRDALGVTGAAQLGVAPVLIPRFGGVPVAALPANLLAAPVAGLVTTWGLPAGMVAAVVEAVSDLDLAAVLHLPTVVAVRWVAEVARVAASLPLGELGGAHVAVAAAGLVLLGARPLVVRAVAAAALVVVLAAPAVVLRHSPTSQTLRQGVVVDRARGATTVVADQVVDPVDLLEDLRRAGVRRVDRLVVGGRTATEVERVVRHRWPVSEVVVQR